jgi:hypothetical protein
MNPRSTAFEIRTLTIKAVDGGFFGGVMVSFRVSKVVDHGFIGGVMVSVLVSKEVDCGLIGGGHYATDEPTIYHF